jgi:hypothetical protein
MHPPERRWPGITGLLAAVEGILRGEAKWDGCTVRRVEYDDQGSFDIPTQVDLVRRAPGPVIIIQKVQARVIERFKNTLHRAAMVYHVPVGSAEDLWGACEEAFNAYEYGEPRIYLRELVGFLIVRKLDRLGRRGGSNKKGFLWADDLPKGGFPKDLVSARDVNDVAAELVRVGVLETKLSMGQKKFALGDIRIVQSILDSRSFENVPQLRKFFEGSGRLVTARLLNYGAE